MKNLKVVLTSFCVLILLSVLLISCEQEIIDLNDITENAVIEQTTNYNALLLPNDVIEQGEAYILEFLDNASDEDIMNYHNNYITFKFLLEVGKLDKVLDGNNPLILDDIELSTILSVDEMNTLNDLLVDSNIIMYRADDAGGDGGGGSNCCICIPSGGGCRWFCP